MTTTTRKGNPIGRLAQRRWPKIVIDTTLLVAFIAEFITREGPDYTIHSWIGIVLIPIIAIHLAGNASWITRVWNRKGSDPEWGLGLLNAVLGTLAVVCILTGFPLWFGWAEGGTMAGVHTFTGMVAILLMFVHLWRNRSRIARLARVNRPVAA